ncbi:MAG TPA: hypothetical protein VG276_31055 [Actinomycetes bacterium]|jgi:hypothetical protein|nr:hypothetical protein [Actinomycetes bacterium]
MTGCHETRPLLPARAEELTPVQAQVRADHVMACSRCAAEAAAYSRLGHALAVLGGLEADPPDGTLERLLVAIGRRRVADPRVAVVAAGSAGALVATIVVAHALRQRRRAATLPPRPRPRGIPRVTLRHPALARAE